MAASSMKVMVRADVSAAEENSQMEAIVKHRIHWGRIIVFGFLSELAVIAVFIPATVWLGEQPGMYVAVAGSLVMPFLFGMLASRKVKSRFIFHGMMVGAVGILIYVGLTRAQPEPLLYIAAH